MDQFIDIDALRLRRDLLLRQQTVIRDCGEKQLLGAFRQGEVDLHEASGTAPGLTKWTVTSVAKLIGLSPSSALPPTSLRRFV
mgnify:CR=1 FL=1